MKMYAIITQFHNKQMHNFRGIKENDIRVFVRETDFSRFHSDILSLSPQHGKQFDSLSMLVANLLESNFGRLQSL